MIGDRWGVTDDEIGRRYPYDELSVGMGAKLMRWVYSSRLNHLLLNYLPTKVP